MSLRLKIIWIFVVFAVIVVILALIFIKKEEEAVTKISNFDECADAGYPILESYPEQCRTPDGRNFTRDIGNELSKFDVIQISSPRPNETVASPLTVTGKARGPWYFEASFPIELQDANGNVIGHGFAIAQDDPEDGSADRAGWMTEEFMSYSTTLTFDKPSTSSGKLILHKDNPSGLPENDDALIIPVSFE